MPFRRIEARLAGPSALGILVPPGARTVVILRPRALECDLLPASWSGEKDAPPVFATFGRDEASVVARQLFEHLDTAVCQGVNPVETLGDAQGRRFQVWLRARDFVWIMCRRAVGQAYQPLVFDTYEQARAAAEILTSCVWPQADLVQDCYFNTQQFG
jgi:hypothetical protein